MRIDGLGTFTDDHDFKLQQWFDIMEKILSLNVGF
jgi:hypothetical protein